jgi:hypothetical protein
LPHSAESSTERLQSALPLFDIKLFNHKLFLTQILAGEMLHRKLSPHAKSAMLFPACRQAGFASFLLHEQKKRKSFLKLREGDL